MKMIHTEIIIDAPIQLVWEVLVDLDNYHLWNTFTPKVESSLKPGDDVVLHVNMNPGKSLLIQKEEVLWNKKEESLAWGITSYFPVRTERAQKLMDLGNNQTKYFTHDKFWGPLVPLVMLLFRKKIVAGFENMARDLKQRAEFLAQ